jgi:polyhydroxybutyrate depolymerase
MLADRRRRRGQLPQWPGPVPPSRLAARLLRLDRPSTALGATKVIWQFFTTHPR